MAEMQDTGDAPAEVDLTVLLALAEVLTDFPEPKWALAVAAAAAEIKARRATDCSAEQRLEACRTRAATIIAGSFGAAGCPDDVRPKLPIAVENFAHDLLASQRAPGTPRVPEGDET